MDCKLKTISTAGRESCTRVKEFENFRKDKQKKSVTPQFSNPAQLYSVLFSQRITRNITNKI